MIYYNFFQLLPFIKFAQTVLLHIGNCLKKLRWAIQCHHNLLVLFLSFFFFCSHGQCLSSQSPVQLHPHNAICPKIVYNNYMHMRRLVWGFTGGTYHIVGNLMSRLISFFFTFFIVWHELLSTTFYDMVLGGSIMAWCKLYLLLWINISFMFRLQMNSFLSLKFLALAHSFAIRLWLFLCPLFWNKLRDYEIFLTLNSHDHEICTGHEF